MIASEDEEFQKVAPAIGKWSSFSCLLPGIHLCDRSTGEVIVSWGWSLWLKKIEGKICLPILRQWKPPLSRGWVTACSYFAPADWMRSRVIRTEKGSFTCWPEVPTTDTSESLFLRNGEEIRILRSMGKPPKQSQKNYRRTRKFFKLRCAPDLFFSMSPYYLQLVLVGAGLCSAFQKAPTVLEQCQTSMVAFVLKNTF